MENKLEQLTRKLYDEGLEKGRAEADRVLAEARKEAERIVAEAHAEADSIVRKAQAKAEDVGKNTMTEIALAGRQPWRRSSRRSPRCIVGAAPPRKG